MRHQRSFCGVRSMGLLGAHVSARSDVMDGPFHVGKGLPASVLADVHEVALDHVRENYEGLPYCARLAALAVPSQSPSAKPMSRIHHRWACSV